ncbi:hypothetical protein I7I53_05334 [Histoplasma capsulatum var. duboisii H88]|uniref:Uncharacterized protein n=1 Tax=Ajellomyces capsulatus (strain H88) TaxID=544711 RepID=A0A8A1LSD1_AJEC8|nr:hypothetical protein I7I53_05334 [Histoplasma capsulatum var. duboisii H88]
MGLPTALRLKGSGSLPPWFWRATTHRGIVCSHNPKAEDPHYHHHRLKVREVLISGEIVTLIWDW